MENYKKIIASAIAATGSTDPHAIAEQLVDLDVCAGEYEGCSSDLEMAFQTYENEAAEQMAAAR